MHQGADTHCKKRNKTLANLLTEDQFKAAKIAINSTAPDAKFWVSLKYDVFLKWDNGVNLTEKMSKVLTGMNLTQLQAKLQEYVFYCFYLTKSNHMLINDTCYATHSPLCQDFIQSKYCA